MGATPFLLPADPKANYLAHKDEIDQAIDRVLDSGCYILGQEVAAFEQEFARHLRVRHAVGVGSGTDALYLALRACGIGPGDAVITVSHTAIATVAAIELAGATPVLVDIDPSTFTIDPDRLEGAIKDQGGGRRSAVSGHPKAIIPVHLYGHPANLPAIMEIAKRYDAGLALTQDAAVSAADRPEARPCAWSARRRIMVAVRAQRPRIRGHERASDDSPPDSSPTPRGSPGIRPGSGRSLRSYLPW